MTEISVNIVSSENERIFFGKTGAGILTERLDGCAKEGARYSAHISADCPLADKELLQYMINNIGGCKKVIACGGKISVTDNFSASNEEKNLDIPVLDAEKPADIAEIYCGLQKMINQRHIENGVIILNPQSCHIDFDVIIDEGVTIYPNNFITGGTVIKKGCVLMPNNCINGSVLMENVTVRSSTLEGATVGKGSAIGPNAYLRPDAVIGENCRIGDFVEIKNSQIGNNTKISHLTYVGDARIGENCNIGCGVVFANYDGKTKHKTYVGDNCFMGSNCNLIAPLKINDNVFVAAGTTVTKDLPQNAFCIGRARPEIKENMAEKYLNRK